MTNPTPYQLGKLVGLNKRNAAELAQLKALSDAGKRPDIRRVKLLRQALKEQKRLERDLKMTTADALALVNGGEEMSERFHTNCPTCTCVFPK